MPSKLTPRRPTFKANSAPGFPSKPSPYFGPLGRVLSFCLFVALVMFGCESCRDMGQKAEATRKADLRLAAIDFHDNAAELSVISAADMLITSMRGGARKGLKQSTTTHGGRFEVTVSFSAMGSRDYRAASNKLQEMRKKRLERARILNNELARLRMGKYADIDEYKGGSLPFGGSLMLPGGCMVEIDWAE